MSFPAQNLPSWSSFEAAFPKNMGGPKVYEYVGGAVYTYHLGDPNTRSNACALRVSRALNYSGITIPETSNTFKGADNKNYFLSAKALNTWMRKTFGTNDGDPKTPTNTNHHHYTAAQAGVHGENLPGLLNGKKGIYSLISSDPRWASGHADMLYSNATCEKECHFSDAPILYIDIWILN